MVAICDIDNDNQKWDMKYKYVNKQLQQADPVDNFCHVDLDTLVLSFEYIKCSTNCVINGNYSFKQNTYWL